MTDRSRATRRNPASGAVGTAKAAADTAAHAQLSTGRENLAGAIYGTILTTAMVAAFSEDHTLPASRITGGVVGTVLVFWIAHAYARSVAESRAGSGSPFRALPGAMRHERPMLHSAVVPTLILMTATVGLTNTYRACAAAIGFGVVALFGWGFAVGRRNELSRGRLLLFAFANAALGLVIVALKIAIH